MRRDRGKYAALHLWMQQWPTHGQIVGGRASSCREYDAVGIDRTEIVVVDPDTYLYHTWPCTAGNHDIIECQKLFIVSILIQCGVQHCAFINPYRCISLQVIGQFRRQIIWFKL